jgi:predicted AAA+ superfamily ATPase
MFQRRYSKIIDEILLRGKSLLVLGPRQVGKTTLLTNSSYDLKITLLHNKSRQRYEKNPDILIKEVEALKTTSKISRVFIDEIQLVPALLSTIQWLIDEKKAQFVLTGSSARKLRQHSQINFLPGRLVTLRMHSLLYSEHHLAEIEDLLLYGELPGILNESSKKAKNQDLESYVITYLEEEIRKEAITKNLPAFYRFLEMAALESGKIISLREIGSDVGVTHNTIGSYFEILEDSMILQRIDPYTESSTRKKLTKSSRYLFFDMGVRRLAAKEGIRLGKSRLGELFEHYIGLELYRLLQFYQEHGRPQLSFWRDPSGPEVDWLIKFQNQLIPVEVKFKENIQLSDCKHLLTFLKEYPQAKHAYVVCLTPNPMKISEKITAIPWNQLEPYIKQDLLRV